MFRRISFILLLATPVCMDALAQVAGRVVDTAREPIAGATVHWLGTTVGTTTDTAGRFSIDIHDVASQLVVSFMGYESDTIVVTRPTDDLQVTLREGLTMDEIEVVERQLGTMKMRSSVVNADMISTAELARAACCNLGESFTTNPSVDVSYSDAATGAKQIRLLGLSGTYVQMLTENIPNYRGAAAPYALGYIPGPWMQSIQVSKGSSSVKNGYEAITGQINVEFLKPQADPAVHANVYGNTMGKLEANADANVHLTQRLSTALLAHYERDTRSHDGNGDGFMDLPRVEQVNVMNRWAWMGDHYVFQAALKVLSEDRTSGQSTHSHSSTSTADATDPYRIAIDTRRYEAFTKNAYIFNKERATNVALILSASLHEQDAAYGRKQYDVDQRNAYASLMFETDLSDPRHSLSMGLSLNHDYYSQRYRLTADASTALTRDHERETTPGAYIQYTFNGADRLLLMGGLRVDHSSAYGTFITPRAHLKWTPSDVFTLRASIGKGYRTNHVLAENNYLLASGRTISIDDDIRQEEAWNYGLSTALYIPIGNRTLNLSAEYYYTDFSEQLVADVDSDPHAVHFGNLSGRSYSHTLQTEASYPLFKGFTLTAAYRLTDVRSTYGDRRLSRPLTSRYKGLVTASYETPLALWQFDVTLQLNGGGRMPTPYETDDAGTLSWSPRFHAYEQLSAQVTRWFRHWSIYVGGENITGYKQKNPIVAASNPWSSNFDSTMVYAPVHGAVYYVGFRFNWAKL